MGDGNIIGKKPDLYISDFQGAVTEHDGVGSGELGLDLASTLPPPAHDIHNVAIVCEQRSVCSCVVAIPSLLLPYLQVPDLGFVTSALSADF